MTKDLISACQLFLNGSHNLRLVRSITPVIIGPRTKAAYRFFRNEKVKCKEITNSHIRATKERCREYSTVLAIQDTSYCNYSLHPKTKGLCPLTRLKGKHQEDSITMGLIMHSTFVVGTDGLPLGIADQKIYSRPELSKNLNAKEKREFNKSLPSEEKDSYRWIESLENTHVNLSSDTKCHVVTICDREADMYDLFLRAQQLKESFIVRANYDRRVNKKSRHSEITGEYLWELLKNQPCASKIQIRIPKQKNIAERTASCEVRFSQFTMNIPEKYCQGKQENPTDLNLYAIYISEMECPQGYEPIDWMLITNIAVLKSGQAIEKVTWYCLRWRIETWHKVLKSGLQIEKCRLSTLDRLIRYLSIMSIVAWRIYWVTLIARITPDASCRIFLNDTEWKILAIKFTKSSVHQMKEPTLEQAVKWIAQLGGFLARKSDKQPGITYIWRGMKKLAAMLEGFQISEGDLWVIDSADGGASETLWAPTRGKTFPHQIIFFIIIAAALDQALTPDLVPHQTLLYFREHRLRFLFPTEVSQKPL